MADNPSDLVGKEFVFEYGLDRIMPPGEKTGGTFALEQRAYRRERVIRCRDCRYYARTFCKLHEVLVPDSDDDSGFCAWGEPREED